MAVHYYMDQENDLLVGEISGVTVVDDVIKAAHKIFTETGGTAFYKNTLVVVEPDTLASLMDVDALIRLRSFLESWGDRLPGRKIRTVFLCEDPNFRPLLLKRWQELSKDTTNYEADVRIMTNREDAIAWLKEVKPAQPDLTRAR